MGPRGFACLFLGEVTILIHLSIFKKKRKKLRKKYLYISGSLLQEEYEVSGVSGLAIFALTASR